MSLAAKLVVASLAVKVTVKRIIVGRCAIGDRTGTVGGGDCNGRCHVIIGPVELGSGGIVVAYRIGKVLAATSMVVAPAAEGVKVAV